MYAIRSYYEATRSLQSVKGAGGISSARSVAEGKFAQSWATNIWADMLT